MSDPNVIAVSIPATSTRFLFAQGPVRLMGWALTESTGAAAAACELYDGNDATGQSLAPIQLGTNESIRDWFGAHGILAERGLYLNVTAGSVRGTLFVEIPPAATVNDEQITQ